MIDADRDASCHPVAASTAAAALPLSADEQYALLMGHLNIGVFQSTLSGEFLVLNDALAAMAGYSRDELQARSALCLYAEADVRTQMMHALLRDGEVRHGGVRALRKDGSPFWMSIHAVLRRDEHGTPRSIFGVVADVTERKQVEEELRLFRESVQHSSDAIGIATADGEPYYRNAAFARLFADAGPKQAELLYRDPRQAQEIFASISAGGSWQGEVEMFGRDGALLTVLLRGYAIRDAEERVIGLVGVHTDITARKRAEQAIRDGEARLNEAMKQAQLAHWEMDAQTLMFTFNDRFYALYATSAEREGGYQMPARVYASEFLAPEDQHLLAELGREMTTRGLDEVQSEHGIRRRDGEARRILVRVTAVRDADGRMVGSRGTNQDITEIRRAEAALFASQSRDRAMLQAIPDLVFRLTSAGVVLDYKADVRDLYVAPEPTLIGRDISGLLPPFLSALISERIAAALHTGDVQTFEYQLQMPDRGPRDYEARMAPSGADEVTAIVRDVTEIRRAAAERAELAEKFQQSQKLESLGVLAGGIAHDFNNLLAVILGNASMALDALPKDSPARHGIEAVDEASRRAAELVRQILAYAGQGRVLCEPMDFGALVRDMTGLLRSTLSKKATLATERASALPPIEGDPGQIRQVVMNLIVNASEALGAHDGIVTVSTGVRDCDAEYLRGGVLDDSLDPGRYVFVEVSDTGCGMDAATMRRVFEPFFTTKFLGRGLGMAAVLGILRAHRGTIHVRSELGFGSTFTVLFPAFEDPRVATPRAPRVSDPARNWRGEGRLLLVDDDDAVRRTGEALLRRLGFDVVTAADGREACDLFRARGAEFALVICDVAMPRMDGAATLHALRQMQPAVRVIMTTGHDGQAVLPELGDDAIAGFLQKPFDLQSLRTVLRRALGT
ncbi:MAG: PAS domain S-box protein [Gemmatimonadota bacterium]|nr:PAS domain S-box protein [Gemmatimonadota bacterium]